MELNLNSRVVAISQMCLLARYPPPIHLSHPSFYRNGSTTSHVDRRTTGPGANPASYHEAKTAAHTEPVSFQKQIDANGRNAQKSTGPIFPMDATLSASMPCAALAFRSSSERFY